MPHHKRPEDRMRRDREGETRVNVNSMYGAAPQAPRVMLTVGDAKPLQFSTDEARRVARLLFEAAEAAEQDGFIIEHFTEVLGLEMNQAAQVLDAFRKHRTKWMDDEL